MAGAISGMDLNVESLGLCFVYVKNWEMIMNYFPAWLLSLMEIRRRGV